MRLVYFDLWQLTRSRKVKDNTSPHQVHLDSVTYRNRPCPTYFHQFGARHFPRPRRHLNFNHLPSVHWHRKQEQQASDALIDRVAGSLCPLHSAVTHKLRYLEGAHERAGHTLVLSSFLSSWHILCPRFGGGTYARPVHLLWSQTDVECERKHTEKTDGGLFTIAHVGKIDAEDLRQGKLDGSQRSPSTT